ncbi:MAG TPA: DUF1028 domain-containing protein, partial [Gaiellales bacterium]|nr:DUF1028 domain-containing protein [Gaiellales bacterium]
LAAADERRDQRQVAVLAADGVTAAFTGSDTIAFAGDVQGDGFSCQANMMAAPGVPEAMRDAFVVSDGPLPRRLLGAMRAAEAAGDSPAASRSSSRGPYPARLKAWVATTPTPARPQGQIAPTPITQVCTATPIRPSPSRATIEYVMRPA